VKKVAKSDIDPASASILYVDDEEMACKYFVRAFAGEYHVLTARSTDAAIDILRLADFRIDVVVTDYKMPGRDGGDLLRQIEHEFPLVVRILVTAYANKNLLLETVNSGEIFRILEKPLDLTDVRSALRSAVELARARNDRKNRFTAIEETLAFLAHELNTPLAAISNFARGVQRRTVRGEASPQEQHEIEKVALSMQDNARYCQKVLSSFVESVQQAGTSSVGRANPMASQLIESLLDTYPLTAPQRAMIELQVEQDFRITAMPNCVLLVLSSILGNSLDMLRDTAEPLLRFVVMGDERPAIHVVDNGPGVPAHAVEILLQNPVDAHGDVGDKDWGMVFCKRVMESFGGTIRIPSLAGKSAGIILDFPVCCN
jgi:two-component system response regulator PhcR